MSLILQLLLESMRYGTYLGSLQYPPTLPNHRLKSLQTRTRMKHKTQIPHVLVPLIPRTPIIRYNSRKPHDPIFLLPIPTSREQRN